METASLEIECHDRASNGMSSNRGQEPDGFVAFNNLQDYWFAEQSNDLRQLSLFLGS